MLTSLLTLPGKQSSMCQASNPLCANFASEFSQQNSSVKAAEGPHWTDRLGSVFLGRRLGTNQVLIRYLHHLTEGRQFPCKPKKTEKEKGPRDHSSQSRHS